MLIHVYFVSRNYISKDDGSENFLVKCTDLENVFFTFYTNKENFELLDNVEQLTKLNLDVNFVTADKVNTYKIYLKEIKDIG